MNREKLLEDFQLALEAGMKQFYINNPTATPAELLAFINGWQKAGEYAMSLIPKFLL